MQLFHLVSRFHPTRQVWVAYPFCMGYRKKANSRILFGIINKHTRGKIGIEKIGKGSYGVAEPPSKSKWYRFGVEFLRTESYITNF